MAFTAPILDRWRDRFRRIYGPATETWFPLLVQRLEQHVATPRPAAASLWNEQDVVLITYGDQITGDEGAPLHQLASFLSAAELDGLVNTIHLLPFYPSSSDDGFSVVDYRSVDPAVGTWQDVARLRARYDLMFDMVLNHVSQRSAWFQRYLADDTQFADFFLDTDPTVDLSAVVRPRSLPLLTPFDTPRGTRCLWTTFSSDQVDLNYGHPVVLIEMLDLLLFYARQGARFIRLDAVAYIWKRIGTPCIHLPEAHEIVKLMRDVISVAAPGVILLTETNVPHRENVSYLGRGDEAHMVYQFSLPPLLLDALVHHDARPLQQWLSNWDSPIPGTTFFNFTASHDGIGVRPLEGLVPPSRIDALVTRMQKLGGLVGTKRNSDGTDTPYELNITYWDALGTPEPEGDDGSRHLQRFLSSQAIMLSLRGIPGVYFHSLLGSGNDVAGARASGIARRINRRKFARHELDNQLADTSSHEHRVLRAYRQLLRVRIAQPAFHPEGPQAICPCDDPAIVAFLRTSPDSSQQVLVVANVSPESRQVDLPLPPGVRIERDLLNLLPPTTPMSPPIALAPFQTAWLALSPATE